MVQDEHERNVAPAPRADREVREILERYATLGSSERKDVYLDTRSTIDRTYSRARQAIRAMRERERSRALDDLSATQFRAYAKLLELSGLTPAEASRRQ
jgi:hypothetical protein